MRRCLARECQGAVGAALRAVCSVPAIAMAQSALLNGKKLPSDAAAAYAEFYRVPPMPGASAEKRTKEHFSTMIRQIAEQQDSLTVQEQQAELKREGTAPILLAGYNFKKKTFALFSVTSNTVIATVDLSLAHPDVWTVADTIMLHTNGTAQFIVLTVAESAVERRALAEPLLRLNALLRSSGMLPVIDVDTHELATALTAQPRTTEALSQQLSSGASIIPTGPLSDVWFQEQWSYLRTAACHATTGDPLHTIANLVFPPFQVFIIHLVRAGSRGLNVSIYEPVRRRHYSAKGMLSDVLACLLDTRARSFILVPSSRTDRPALFRCRAAAVSAGRACTVVFASEMAPALRGVYDSGPARYWEALKTAAQWLDADLLFHVRLSAGAKLRSYRQKTLTEGKDRNYLEHLDTSGTSGEKGSGTLATSQCVQDWTRYFTYPKRIAAEKAAVRRYAKYIAVSYVATDEAAYSQPMNPVARQNYVLSACLTDHRGHTLEPWTVYTARGEFNLPKLDEYDVLVSHDAKLLCLLLWDDTELKRFLQRGGRVWCVTLAEYLLDAQRCATGRNSIHTLALRHGTVLPASSRIGIANARLPAAFQRRYCLEAAPVVVCIFRAQLRRAVDQSQMLSILHRMDSLLAMASMEWAGIKVDAVEATRQTTALRNAAGALDNALAAYTPPEVPRDMEMLFDWRSMQQLHALFFGGSITLGNTSGPRESAAWTSNLVHLCHRYGDFTRMIGELHLQRYAAECGLPSSGRLPARIAKHIQEQGTQKGKTYRLVLFDVETTGLNSTTDKIIEIAAFDPVENTLFHTLINPQRPITPRTVSIHHINDALVQDAPTMDTVALRLCEFLRLDKAHHNPDEVLILVGHNVFSIDEPMLRRAMVEHAPEAKMDGVLFCDSLSMLVALRSEVGGRQSRFFVEKKVVDAITASLRLGDLITALQVRPDGAMHRADTDTRALWYVLVHVFGLVGKPPAEQREVLLTYAANTLLRFPSKGCFVATGRKTQTVRLQLPGIAAAMIPDAKLVKKLRSSGMSDAVLLALSQHGVRVAGLLLQRQQLERHLASFLQPDRDGRLGVLHPDGCIHQHIDMTATTTSRTVSAYPSCQNIPKDDKSSVRRLFVSRFGAQGRCVEVDYAQLEIVVMAILCDDPNLSQDLCGGLDFHVKRAAHFSGLPYEDIRQGYKRGVPKYVKLRKTAKQFSFQRLYGAGVRLLHKTTGIPVEDLKMSIQQENTDYPGIAAFHHIVRSVALRPNNPGLPTSFIAEMPTGQRVSFRTRDVVLNLPPVKNYPIQGYGAELAQMMVGRLFRHFVTTDFYKGKAVMTNFVHDAVWIDCHVDVLEQCIQDTSKILSSVHEYVPKTFPGVTVSVPLGVSAHCGVDMCSMQAITDGDLSFVRRQTKSKSAVVSDFLQLNGKLTLSTAVEESVATSEEEEDSAALAVVEERENDGDVIEVML